MENAFDGTIEFMLQKSIFVWKNAGNILKVQDACYKEMPISYKNLYMYKIVEGCTTGLVETNSNSDFNVLILG